jgi:hypothetical protein
MQKHTVCIESSVAEGVHLHGPSHPTRSVEQGPCQIGKGLVFGAFRHERVLWS